MSLIEVKKQFTHRELLWFGPLFALFVGIIGGILIKKCAAYQFVYWLWVTAAGIIVLYYLIPRIRRPTYLAWLYAVMPIGWVISHLLLAGIYYLLLTPTGLLMKLCGYDPLRRRFDRSCESYWICRDKERDASTYFKQY